MHQNLFMMETTPHICSSESQTEWSLQKYTLVQLTKYFTPRYTSTQRNCNTLLKDKTKH